MTFLNYEKKRKKKRIKHCVTPSVIDDGCLYLYFVAKMLIAYRNCVLFCLSTIKLYSNQHSVT